MDHLTNAKSGDGLDAPHVQPAKTITYYATNLIAFIERKATFDNALIAAFCLMAAQTIVAIVRAI